VREAYVTEGYGFSPIAGELLDAHGVRQVDHGSEGY
jgi:hypothetical protein